MGCCGSKEEKRVNVITPDIEPVQIRVETPHEKEKKRDNDTNNNEDGLKVDTPEPPFRRKKSARPPGKKIQGQKFKNVRKKRKKTTSNYR